MSGWFHFIHSYKNTPCAQLSDYKLDSVFLNLDNLDTKTFIVDGFI